MQNKPFLAVIPLLITWVDLNVHFETLEGVSDIVARFDGRQYAKKLFLMFCMDAIRVPLDFSWFLVQIILS